MKFDLPKDQASIIKVFGVGGGGSNAVNHMYNQGISGVDFVICNTDAQALEQSPIPNKIQLGTTLTEGLGAGANPEVGRNAAIEDIENIKGILEKNTKMVFITAGMGGGTGTGAAPIIAETAREMGILTVGIVTIPFSFEGRRRKLQADEGLAELKKHVDTLLVINNDKLRMMHGNLKMGEAFSKADDILTTAAKGIAEIITVAGYINVDFEDVKTVMKDGGTAIMGSALGEGENRSMDAVTKALSSPLLNDNEIKGANFILLNVTSGDAEITMDEIDEITDYIQNEAGYTAELIWGNGTDESLGDKVSVTVIATGFGESDSDNFEFGKKPEKKVFGLDEDVPTNITQSFEETEENLTEGVTEELEGPTLKTDLDEQSILNFDTASSETKESMEEEPISEKEQVEKVIFNLEDTSPEEEEFTAEVNDEPVLKTKEEETSWNWSEVNDGEIEASSTEETTDFTEEEEENTLEDFTSKAEEETSSETNDSVVWNLNDDDSTEEFTSESTEFTVDNSSDEITFEKKETFSENDLSEEEGPVYTNRIPDEEQLKRSQERIMKIKELGMKMKTPSGINDLENEPAYRRRKINLDETPHSSENPISRFTLSDDEEGKPKLNDDNSFLHDNVD
jgi:cell division protein FtsZ